MKNHRRIRFLSNPYFLYLLSAVLFGAVIYFGFFYESKFSFNQDFSTKEQSVSQEAEDLARRVGKLIFLPSDEIPTIATVAKPELLTGQEFFKDAKAGDKVLIYERAKKAVLYDPRADKIITIAPLVVDEKGGSNINTDTVDDGSMQF